MNKLPKWLGWTLKVIWWMCLIPISLVVLAVLTGWVGDLTASAKWEAGRKRAEERIQNLKTLEFSSGYAFAVNEANAWDYYLKSSAPLDSLGNRKLDSLVFNTPFNPKEASKLLSQYKKEITLWDSGACSRYCRIELEYEKGLEAPIPNYAGIQKMFKLVLLKGRMEVALGQVQQGAVTYSKALKIAMDISGGSETLLNRMVGIVAGKLALRIIAGDISRFDRSSVLQLQDALKMAEKGWPPTYPSINMEAWDVYSFSNDDWDKIWNGSRFITSPLLGFLSRVRYSLLSWKHFFSLKRDMLSYCGLMRKLTEEAAQSKDKPWSCLAPVLKQNEEYTKKATKGEVFAAIAMPNFWNFFRREYEFRMGLRVLKDALILREYSLKNGKYPAKLDQAVKDSPENNDIADGLPLKYFINQDKSVWLYSVGLNLADDGGKNFVLSEGITRSTINEAQDDIGIKLE